jgi:hypothetical protein
MLESLLDDPPDTPWNKWGRGIALPVLVTVYGARVIVVQHLALRPRGLRPMTGSDAWWIGLAILGIAAFLHCHFFWSNHLKLAPYAELGKCVSLLTIFVGMGVMLFNHPFRLL